METTKNTFPHRSSSDVYDPLDIEISNRAAKHVLHTGVLHPPLFKQVPESRKKQGDPLVCSARRAYWNLKGGEEVEQEMERQEEMIDREREGKGVAHAILAMFVRRAA